MPTDFCKRIFTTSLTKSLYSYGNKILCGTTAETIIGKRITDFIKDAADAERIISDDKEIFEKGLEKIIPEEKFTDINGDLHWFHTVKRSLQIGGNGDSPLLCIATDLTERKILESHVRHGQKMESIGHSAVSHFNS